MITIKDKSFSFKLFFLIPFIYFLLLKYFWIHPLIKSKRIHQTKLLEGTFASIEMKGLSQYEKKLQKIKVIIIAVTNDTL